MDQLMLTPMVAMVEMAVRLSMAFGTTSESWLNHQVQYDLWQAEKRRESMRVMKLAA